ncbi:hypothetical protein [Salana multivorans]
MPFWWDEADVDDGDREYVLDAGLPFPPTVAWEINLSAAETERLWHHVVDAIDKAELRTDRRQSLGEDELAAVLWAVREFLR